MMKQIVLAMLAVLSLSALSGCASRASAMTDTPSALRDSAMTNTPQTFSADDESAVRALVNGFANAWNHHDMKAMHELNTEDVEWINTVGHYWRGKANVYKGHTAIHNGMSAKTSMSVESATVRSIAPNVAMAVATMYFLASPDPVFQARYGKLLGGAKSKTRGSFTMVKRDGIWKIAHFQITIIDPKAENDDATKWEGPGYPLYPEKQKHPSHNPTAP